MNLNDYQAGFMGSEKENAVELLKSMQAGSITGRDTTNLTLTMEPLKVESLETTLKVLTFRAKDIKLWNRIPKLTAYNTVEEYLQQQSYGTPAGGFYGEGELADNVDSEFVRRAQHVKYIQVVGEVTLQAQVVRSYVNAMRQAVEDKAMWVMERANSALTKANSGLISQQWDSLYTQHGYTTGADALYTSLEDYYTSNVVIDLRGKSLKQEHVEDATIRVDANFGNVSDLCAPPSVISALAKDYFDTQRIIQGGSGFSGDIGIHLKSISTTMGDVNLLNDKFMKTEPEKLLTANPTSAKAPNAPTAGAVPALVVDALSKYQVGETGAVHYAVSAFNRFGESALTLLTTGGSIAVTVGSAIDLTFTATASPVATTGYRIYRTKIGVASTGQFFPILEVSTAELATGYDGAAATKVRDRGRILPDMEKAFVTEMAEEVLSFKQLAPISKLDLAVQGPSNRFMTFLWGTPILYTPKKFVIFVNAAKTLVA